MGVLFLSPFSFYMYVCFVLTIFISFVVLCCKFLGLAMVLAKFCCQAMCNFCSRRKILKEKKKNRAYNSIKYFTLPHSAFEKQLLKCVLFSYFCHRYGSKMTIFCFSLAKKQKTPRTLVHTVIEHINH